ncbi:phage baseplate assembly protein V (plasmid) [Photobacterium damselae subsp. damselae]
MYNNNNNQSRHNPSGAMSHAYQAKVINTKHPEGLFMAKVRIMGLWDSIPEEDIPWAEFLLPLGAKQGAGHHIPVEVEDIVWVDFPRLGDTRYPRITGSVYYAPDKKSYLPTDSSPGKGEPAQPALSLNDDVYERFGIQEYKTSKGAWGVVHMPTGTRIEISEAGIVIHAEGNNSTSTSGNKTEKVDGELTLKIQGPANVDAEELNFKSEGDVNFDAGGSFNVKATNADYKLG